MSDNKKEVWRALKFTLFSISAGVIQFGSATIMQFFINEYWIYYTISLTLSVLWNFTLNRQYTFKSATNVPIAMLKVFGFYLVFAPTTIILGQYVADLGVHGLIVEGVTMLLNFVLEYLFCKFVVYRGQEDTLEHK